VTPPHAHRATLVLETIAPSYIVGIERFPPKWPPVRRRKRDKIKNHERDPFSLKNGSRS
jgi:hypothetical protein